MKKRLYYYIASALMTLLGAQGTFAQEVAKVDTLPMITITAKSEVNRKVHDAFKGKFNDAVNAKWSRIDQNYLVKFISKDQKNHALYNKNGYLYYHIAYGSEESLPQSVRDQVSRDYKNAKILTVIQVNQENRSIWVLNIDYGKLLILAREENGELHEVQRFNKGS